MKVELRVWNCNNNVDWAFMPYSFLTKHKINPNINYYHLIYDDIYEWDDNKSINENLSDIFIAGNLGVFTDWDGHSLSVSDVIEISGKYWYVDTFGFKEVFRSVFEAVNIIN